MLTNHELLRTVAEEKKHTFISTGMSTMDEIRNAVNIFREYDVEIVYTSVILQKQ